MIEDDLCKVGEAIRQSRARERALMKIAANLARAAHENGVPKRQIALKLGVTRPTVYAWLKQPD